MRKIILLSLAVLLMGGGVVVGWRMKSITKPEAGTGDAGLAIVGKLPRGAMMRDFEKIEGAGEGAYLVVYVEPGYKMDDPVKPEMDYMSCPGAILGQAIRGVNHVALYRGGKIVSDLMVPFKPGIEGNEAQPAIVYRNTKSNLYGIDVAKPGAMDLETVKLIKLADYIGEGKPFQFLLTTTGGGCGFYSRILAGYHPETDRVVFFSDWISRFEPTSLGKAHFLFDCGDHGNMTRVERDYEYFSDDKKYEVVAEKETPCKGR